MSYIWILPVQRELSIVLWHCRWLAIERYLLKTVNTKPCIQENLII